MGREKEFDHLESLSPMESFAFYKASWKKDSHFPSYWYEREEPVKPKFRALLWTQPPGAGEEYNIKCRENASLFEQLLIKLNGHNLKAYDLDVQNAMQPISKAEAMLQISSLKNLTTGDCCLIFYTGSGVIAKADNSFFGEPVFSDADNWEASLTSIWSGLDEIPEGVHVFIIVDFQFAIAVDSDRFYQPKRRQLLLLENFPSQLNRQPDISAKPDCFFQDELRDIIEQKGAKMRYSNLINQLHLRYYQAGLQHRPLIKAFPAETLSTYIFSGVAKGKPEYTVSFNEQRNQWEINAGLLNGVYPSLSFMHTIFDLEDGRPVSIKEAFESYSTLVDFYETNISNSYNAVLVQNALPKLKIGFDPSLGSYMREQFINAVNRHDIYFIDLLNENKDAAFLIKARENEYYLVRNSDYMGLPDDRPVFFYQQNTFEFIKQLEYIAQWQALLELDNSRATIENEVDVVVEIFEGLSSKLILNNHSAKGRIIRNPDGVELCYRNKHRPRIKCQVELKNESSYKGNYLVQYLYLDSQFGVVKFVTPGENQLSKSNPVFLKNDVQGKLYDSISIVVEDFYLQNGIREIQDYLLVFISTEPVDLDPLLQTSLEFIPSRQITRGVEMEQPQTSYRRDFLLPRGDWFIKKIPVSVVYDDRSFEDTVRKLIKDKPIIKQTDLHKGRWGGQPNRNGFSLIAKVEKSSIPYMYKVTLTAKINNGNIPDGADIAFLLHNSFSNPLQFVKFENNSAQITVTAYEDFTVAAVLYDGTELELDLSYLPGLPDGFYAKLGSLEFNKQVETILARKSNEIKFPEDLQKGRWGGISNKNGKSLSATVEPEGNTHRVALTVEVVDKKNFNGEVAFLLHDSFKEQVAYRKILDGRATYMLNSYEAFTVGVYISDGTELELDLNKQTGFPGKFYYK